MGIEYGKTYWEWKLTDTTVRQSKDGAITPEALRNLGRFLRATRWKLIYGLNFGCGSPERAAEEAMYVTREVGDHLLSFQVGNEVDFFEGRPIFRQKPYDFDQYFREYGDFVETVRARVPRAPFASRYGYRYELGRPLRSAYGNFSQDAFKSFLRYGTRKDPGMDATFLL